MALLYDMVKDIATCTTQPRKALDDLMHGIAGLETLTEVVLPSEQESDAAATALTHVNAAFSRIYRAEFHAARAADTKRLKRCARQSIAIVRRRLMRINGHRPTQALRFEDRWSALAISRREFEGHRIDTGLPPVDHSVNMPAQKQTTKAA